MDKTPTSTDSDGRITRRERIFVFAGPGIAALCAGISLPLGGGVEFLQLCALVGIVWMVLASLACALWQGIARGDWSAFRSDLRDDSRDSEHFDYETRTGAYSYLRDREDRHLHDNDHLR